MNKMSKCTMVSLAVLISACQSIPSVAVADNASAKAEVKPVDPQPEAKVEAKPEPRPEPKPEPKAEAKADAKKAAAPEKAAVKKEEAKK